MQFLDEKVAELQNAHKKSSYGDIHTGVYVREELVGFERVALFEDQMSIILPKSFQDMPEHMAKMKYPSEQRPQVIKTNADGSINFTFSIFDAEIKPEQIKAAKDGFQMIIKQMQPSNVFFEDMDEELGTTMLGWFDFKGFALDAQIYNLMYVSSIGGKILHGIFNCIYEDSEMWKPIACQVMRSVEDLTVS